ncbi:hypothetical protein CROQUDRAFT_661424 [Cronartium quercuum f. sp. fusiforme G11]|uniref:RING-type E3 ubiquitin transferase n=1 Tax=Cronartium quercuum f. sp. fusiforme G11 TaxID=708437 RepID=A0A9P6T977_9BASI|nr:hypothetical protein CROQUDRAFT_661424 [Cronartium quercuum f. sp. fusiforme G11]
MGQAAQPHNPAPTTTAATQPEAADDDRIPNVADDFTQVRWTDDGDHLHNPTPPPPLPRGGGVNVEEGHPLRELISLLSSLVPPNNDGFIIGGGTGGARFEFGAGAGGQFGDYVFSDTGLQDVMDQLMNMAGVAGTGHQPVPASEAKIKSLRRFKVDPKTLDGEPGECAICKEEYVAEEECMQLPCKHVFHAQDCITPWLKRNGTCPVCRFSLVNDPSDDPEDVPLEPQANGSGSGRSMADLAAEAAERRYRDQHEEPALDVD